MNCDTFLLIRTGPRTRSFAEGQARGVQIDIAPRMLSLRYPMEVPRQGDYVTWFMVGAAALLVALALPSLR